jgi:hypothetical protein
MSNNKKMKYPIRISNLFDEKKIEILHNLKRKKKQQRRIENSSLFFL